MAVIVIESGKRTHHSVLETDLTDLVKYLLVLGKSLYPQTTNPKWECSIRTLLHPAILRASTPGVGVDTTIHPILAMAFPETVSESSISLNVQTIQRRKGLAPDCCDPAGDVQIVLHH